MLIKLIFMMIALSCPQARLQAAPQEELRNPRETFRTFLTGMKKYKQGQQQAIGKVLKTLELEQFDQASRESSGRLAAVRLITVLDKLEKINYDNIPTKPSGSSWSYRRDNLLLEGNEQSAEITLVKNEQGSWRFSAKTLESLFYYERFLRDKDFVSGIVHYSNWKDKFKGLMPDWTGEKTFLLLNGQWLGLILLIFFAFLLEKILQLYIASLVTSILTRKSITVESTKKKKFTRPFGLVIFAGTFHLFVPLIEFSDQVLAIFFRAATVLITIGAVWSSYLIVDMVSYYFESLAKKSENKFDDILVPLLRKTAKVVVLCLGVVFICQSLTLNVTNVLAGLGIGGLAFALAAKDTVSNLFGSLTVILDRPFQIGDWVVVGKDIEGIVTEVGFRSTRLRTFYDSIISVPNSQLTNIHIDNYGRRSYRRFSTKIGVEYSTPPEKIEAFCEAIRQIILQHKWTRKDNFHVYFNGMGNSALEILLYVFWKVPDWSSELQERHRLLIDIIRVGEKLGISFAFPTSTIHLYQEEAKDIQNLKENYFETGKKEAMNVIQRPLSFSRHRSGVTQGQDFPPDSPSL